MYIKVTLENFEDPSAEHRIILLEIPDNCTTDARVELYIKNNTKGALIRWERIND